MVDKPSGLARTKSRKEGAANAAPSRCFLTNFIGDYRSWPCTKLP
jgi:hypothetical protein